EWDKIRIDEARTPLIIAGQPEQAADLYYKFAKLARIMEPGKKPEGLEAKSKEWEAGFDFDPGTKQKPVGGAARAAPRPRSPPPPTTPTTPRTGTWSTTCSRRSRPSRSTSATSTTPSSTAR